MTTLHDYRGLLLGSRLKRLSELMYAGVDDVYEEHGVRLSSRCFPILFLLRDNGPQGITELATLLGQSHAAVSQMSHKLLEHGVVEERTDPKDERRRLLELTSEGRALMKKMAAVWKSIEGAVNDLVLPHADKDFLGTVAAIDEALSERSFASRIRACAALQAGKAVEIVPFEPALRDDFRRLNIEWLEKYFYVEAIDHEVLSNPERSILARGGFIFFARHEGETVGTCALIHHRKGRYELSKMAVTERHQGLRIGRRLLERAVSQFQKAGGRELFLESSSKLKPAIRLYETSGFVHSPRPEPSHYQRSDVYMVYRGKRAPR